MSEKRRRSPPEKKALSYVKDCRNSYGENDKAARKAIPSRKAGENRRSRRKADQALTNYDKFDEGEAALVESSLRHEVDRVGGWKKAPDQPLGERIADRFRWRKWREGRKQREQGRRGLLPD